MTTIFELAADALATITPAVAYAENVMQMASGDLPDTYMVYLVVSGVPEQHADNAETHRSYRVQVSIYCRNGLAVLPNVDAAMIAAGFQRGPERELPFDEGTRHFGLAKDYFYLQ